MQCFDRSEPTPANRFQDQIEGDKFQHTISTGEPPFDESLESADALIESFPIAGDQSIDEDDSTADGRATDEPAIGHHDHRATSIIDFLSKVLRDMGMEASVRRRPRMETRPDEIQLEIIGYDVGRVIGKKGQVLSALQSIVNRVANRYGADRRHVILDAEGYRQRRESNLESLARRLAEQAVRESKVVTFEPMSPRDRRVVHVALANYTEVITKSDGDGSERRVRIIPVRK